MTADPRDPKEPSQRERDVATIARVHASANPGAYMWGSWNPTRMEADRQGNVQPAADTGHEAADRKALLDETLRTARLVRNAPPEVRRACVDAFLYEADAGMA